MMQSPWSNSMFSFRHIALIGLFLSSLFISMQSHADTLTSIVNRNIISIDETLELVVRYSGQRSQDQPDFSQLNKQFEVLSTRQSNQFQSLNGKVTSFTDWTITLAPREKGKLIIPSFHFAGQVSDALSISVVEAAPTPVGTVKDVFIETVVDKSSIYVQEEVIVRYKLYYSINVDSLDAQPLELENVVKVDLPDTRYTRKINNKLYRVAEYAYALFPQTSGTLTIPVLRWDIKMPKDSRNRNFFGFSGRYEISRQRTEEKTIDVRPRPTSFPANKPWIPASQLTLEESWSTSPRDFKIGEPITRNITLTAKGLMASQLPKISQDIENNDVKTYADQPSINDETTDKGVHSVRTESAAVVIASGGPINLPAIKVPWWDTTTDTLKYAEIPAQTIQSTTPAPSKTITKPVLPQESDEGQVLSSEQLRGIDALKDQIFLWQIICLFLLLALLSNIVLWWRSNKNNHVKYVFKDQQASKKVLWTQLVKSCKTNKPQIIRDGLLMWAKHYWHPEKIHTLADIAKKVNDDEINQQLRILDVSLYGTDTSEAIDGEKLTARLKLVLESKNSASSKDNLQAFYAT